MKLNNNNTYIPRGLEKKWSEVWNSNKIYQLDLGKAKKPFYNLMMFPYPSAEGLHVGSFFTYTGIDVQGRFQRMKGNDVFEPIGLDGFGIHSENYAIKVGRTPKEHAKISESNFYRQLQMLGNGFDWSKKLETYDPNYYKWTQWIFTQLFKEGLAYKKEAPVNFCPSCKTVLANEQVIDSKCERCGSSIEKKSLSQWFFKITTYADRLLNNIENLDWVAKVKTAQKNWIGRKSGITIDYPVVDQHGNQIGRSITIFTTRPETNFGGTFIAIAPEHNLIPSIIREDKRGEVNTYIEQSIKKSSTERQSEGKKKTGIFTGYYALNRLNAYLMPIFVSDFVLMDFGTGAVVGVPGHDKRDFEFAKVFDLKIKRVILGKDQDNSSIRDIHQVQEEAGTVINSEFLDGLDTESAKEKIIKYFEKEGWGNPSVTYHLRDWLISRQRYWGPPIPMIFCQSCAEKGESWFTLAKNKNKRYINPPDKNMMSGWYPVEDSQLPVLLPDLEEWKPTGDGHGPLSKLDHWVSIFCPHCNNIARRETDVSDSFLDSAWYFFRYLDTENSKEALSKELCKKWLPVTLYTGGAEHSVLHLLYARFITMFFYDLGLISFEEPFRRFYANGLIIKDGAKMSKSKGNVIIPDDYVEKYGIDALRCYLMFLGPFNQGGDFRDSGIEGMFKFLRRVWTLSQKVLQDCETRENKKLDVSKSRLIFMNKTIKKVTEEISNVRYNTAISNLMEYYNFLSQQPEVSLQELESLLLLLAPFAPYITEEIWQSSKNVANNFKSIHFIEWPKYDASLVMDERIIIAIQINGKLKTTMELNYDEQEQKELVISRAKSLDNIKTALGNNSIYKIIYVPGKIVNFVL